MFNYIRRVTALRWLLGMLFILPAYSVYADTTPATTDLRQSSAQSIDVPFERYHQRHWSADSGLPQVTVTAITQDHDGFIWFATEGGLARFDGVTMTVFDSAKSDLFSNPILTTIHHGQDGTLWVASSSKLIKRTAEGFAEVTFNGKSIENTATIVEAADGVIYVGAERLYQISGEVVAMVNDHTAPVTALYTHNGQLWIASPGQLAVLDAEGYTTVPVIFEHPNTLISGVMSFNDSLLLATNHGLWQLTVEGKLQPARLHGLNINENILTLYRQSNGTLWISTYQTLYQLSQDSLISKTDRTNQRAFPWVEAIFEDRDQNIWLGSRSHGVLRLRTDITANYTLSDGLPDPYVWALASHNGKILVGFNKGLAEFKQGKFLMLGDASQLPNSAVYSLFVDSQGFIWAGTRSGLAKLEPVSYQVVQRFAQLEQRQINGVVEDFQQNIWVATLEGLYRIAAGEAHANKMDESLKLTSAQVRYLHVDNTGMLWIGTAEGLFTLTPGAEQVTELPAFRQHYVSYITQLANGAMVIGTLQNGIAVVQPEGSWRWITAEQGLANRAVLFMGKTTAGFVVSTLQGVYLLNAEALSGGKVEPRVLIDDGGAESGTDGYRCCNGAGNSKGMVLGEHVLLPTLNGIVTLDLAALGPHQKVPTPVIDMMYSNGNWHSPTARIVPGVRDIRFRYTAPTYYRPRSLWFRYRLDGYDDDWTEVNERRTAFYTNLPAGNYRFDVQVRYGGEQLWSDLVSQRIRLPALWYETLTFKLALIVILLIFLRAIYLMRLRRWAQQQVKLELMVADRTHELAEVNQQLAMANEQLRKSSVTDALTGLHNRHYLDQIIEHVLASATRHQQPLQCILIDVDNFKKINDLLGHLVGDQILIKLAQVLQEHVRDSDHLIRWGGEEFLVIQENTASAADFASRLCDAIANTSWPAQEQLPFPVSISIGIVDHPIYTDRQWPWGASLTLADKALYIVKSHGKAGWLSLSWRDSTPTESANTLMNSSEHELLTNDWFRFDGSPAIMQRLMPLSDH